MVETVTEGIKVLVGSTPHPMEEKHYIEWIELINANRTEGSKWGNTMELKPKLLARFTQIDYDREIAPGRLG